MARGSKEFCAHPDVSARSSQESVKASTWLNLEIGEARFTGSERETRFTGSRTVSLGDPIQ